MLCQLMVRTREGIRRETVDTWTALVVTAALSAEPESFDELGQAIRRYQPYHRLFEAADAELPSVAQEDEPWCLIDLRGRTMLVGGGVQLPEQIGTYQPDPDEEAEGFPIVWLDTPPDWLFQQADADWRTLVEARAAQREKLDRVDARPVLFGAPLLEYLADGVLAAAEQGTAGEEQIGVTIRALHANWLMAPRADLAGRTPREVLLADMRRLDRELDHRSQQWSRQGHAVPALSAESTAYRLGGFGTVEAVLYFDLVRDLLAEAWDRLEAAPHPDRTQLIQLLAKHKVRWLNEPYEDGVQTAAQLIESERRRMPVTFAESHGHVDHDCPLCQSMANEEFGPSFMCFDGHHLELEDEFAFSLTETREEWERDQEDYRKFSEEMDRKQQERDAAGTDEAESAWKSTFVDWDAVAGLGAWPRQSFMVLGFPLAELTSDLKTRPDGLDLMRSLNETYAALSTSQDAVAAASTAQAFCEHLEAVGRKFAELMSRCADLQSRADEILRVCKSAQES